MGCKNSTLIGSVARKTIGEKARRRHQVKKDDELSTTGTASTETYSEGFVWNEKKGKVGANRLDFEIETTKWNHFDFEISN